MTGWYRDKSGREWFCVKTEIGYVCDSEHWMTAASFNTFKVWAWEKIEDKQ